MDTQNVEQLVSAPTQHSRWRLDLALVVALTALAAGASVRWQFAEFLSGKFRPVENLQLDEAPGVLLVLALASLWYAWRRYGETRSALARSLRAEQQLAAALSDNRRLARQYAEVQEAERARLSRELHDELGQYLNAVKIDAVSLKRSPEVPAAMGELAESIVRNLDHMQGAVADLIRQLRPVGLDELGVEAALEHCVDGWRGRLPDTALRLRCEGELAGLGEALNLTVYRLVQEGLTNVVRHAMASQVEVTVSRQDMGRPQVAVLVADDGRGMDRSRERCAGLGLIGMRERVEAMGGTLSIETAPGRGFRLAACLPIAPGDG